MYAQALDSRANRVWSLWEMLKAYSTTFHATLITLEQIRSGFFAAELITGETVIAGDHPKLTELTALLVTLERQCRGLDLDSAATDAKRLREALPEGDISDRLVQSLRGLEQRIVDGLTVQKFHYVSHEFVELETNKEPFGEKVSRELAVLSFDINEATACKALERGTACVFHLMRVMEKCVQLLGQRLKVQVNTKAETWGVIVSHINGKVSALPQKTPTQKHKKEQYAACASHLNSVRIAWRNPVMHPRETYTIEEASDIYAHVRTFVRDLVELL